MIAIFYVHVVYFKQERYGRKTCDAPLLLLAWLLLITVSVYHCSEQPQFLEALCSLTKSKWYVPGTACCLKYWCPEIIIIPVTKINFCSTTFYYCVHASSAFLIAADDHSYIVICPRLSCSSNHLPGLFEVFCLDDQVSFDGARLLRLEL